MKPSDNHYCISRYCTEFSPAIRELVSLSQKHKSFCEVVIPLLARDQLGIAYQTISHQSSVNHRSHQRLEVIQNREKVKTVQKTIRHGRTTDVFLI